MRQLRKDFKGVHMQDDDWGLIQFGTAEEARGDYDHDIQRQKDLDDKQEEVK